MSYIDISNYVSVSVSTPPAGLASYKVNNLAIFTKEAPINNLITATNPGVYVSPQDVLSDWGSTSEAYAQAILVFSQSPNILDGGGQLIISPMQSSDTLALSIPALLKLIFFGGALWAGYDPTDQEIVDGATATEALRVKLFANSPLLSALATTTGVLWRLTNASLRHARCLLYTVGASTFAARKMAAAYAGRAMSVDFEGVNTTLTMHGKTLIGITPDSGISQSVLNTCLAVGVDAYPSVGGGAQYIGKVFSTGFNGFFDDVYNLDWLVFAIQVAGADVLFTTGTKIPQTEPGMAVLTNAYISTLQQAVSNGFVAPGEWNSPELFGNPADLRRCVLNQGFYVYHQPVNQQSQTVRVQRKAPPVQIAIKYAGAVHSSNIIVSVNQ